MPRPTPRRRTLGPLVAACAILLPAGCGSGAPAAPPSPFPPRPESVDVSRLDPCSGVSPADARRLDVGRGSPSTATVDGTRSPACTWVGYDDGYNYGAQVIPLSAVGAAGEPGSRVVDVDGFGAVISAARTNNTPGGPAFCQLAVDVADGQTVRFQLNNGRPGTGGRPDAVDATCAEAQRFASGYLRTIRRP